MFDDVGTKHFKTGLANPAIASPAALAIAPIRRQSATVKFSGCRFHADRISRPARANSDAVLIASPTS
jgi:hypothetical protein